MPFSQFLYLQQKGNPDQVCYQNSALCCFLEENTLRIAVYVSLAVDSLSKKEKSALARAVHKSEKSVGLLT